MGGQEEREGEGIVLLEATNMVTRIYLLMQKEDMMRQCRISRLCAVCGLYGLYWADCRKSWTRET